MGDALSSLLAFIVAISVLVAVHEYGHYIVGRWTGMKVLRFSIGFGKPLWTWIGKGNDRTEYCVAAIPVGGYVRFLDSREGPIDPEDDGRAFNQRPIAARIAVLLAGPMFNFLFAIFAYWLLFVYGVPAIKPAIGDVVPDSYASVAGLERGDRIIAVGDVATPDWEAALVSMLDQMTDDGRVPMRLESENGRQRTVVIDVGEDKTRLTEPGLLFDGLGFSPWQAPVMISETSDGGRALEAGLKAGDRLLMIDGKEIRQTSDVSAALQPKAEQTVTLEVERDGRVMTLDAVPEARDVDGQMLGFLGVTVSSDWGELAYMRKYGLIESVSRATARMWSSSVFTLRMLGRMVTGDVSIKNISGPINIAQFAGASAQAGISNFLSFLAIVSISLGVLNLLPIPVLDGGQIVYQVAELLKGSPLSERAQLFGQQVGIFALLLLMSFAFYNDIARMFG
ncbi:MAG: RIP metalloprotease RseP [Woeseiaceae bacterium]|nr:RIP metalloprotease RseP [Woeseiaceae bacterium]